MTEQEKMLAGKIYQPRDQELTTKRVNAHKLSRRFNNTDETDEQLRTEILDQLLPNRGKNAFLQGPIQFDYGVFTTVGDNFYANFNFTVVDCAPVTIGDNVFFGPNCTIATPMHPFLPEERAVREDEQGPFDDEYAKPITVQSNCWICSNVVICGGVTIGEGCVIGAGSVVTRDIPPYSLAAGNPCRVIRQITKEDSIHLKKELF